MIFLLVLPLFLLVLHWVTYPESWRVLRHLLLLHANVLASLRLRHTPLSGVKCSEQKNRSTKSYRLFSEQPLNPQHHFRQENTFFLCLVSSCCYSVSQIQRRVGVVLLTPVKQPQKECKSTVLLEFIVSPPLPHFSNYLASIFPEVNSLGATGGYEVYSNTQQSLLHACHM